jgi:hypothetical protein
MRYKSKELRAGGEGNCNLRIGLSYIDDKPSRHRLSSWLIGGTDECRDECRNFLW